MPQHGCSYAFDTSVEILRQLVLPKPKHDPSATPVVACHLQVALTVPSEFGVPELDVGLWPTTVKSTAVPET